jgi:uncharacterized protein YlxP (DUF503 family)
MILGILQVEVMIDGSQSLKDKRRVVTSLKDRLHREHQVSVAEVDMQDDPGRAVLGIALAASSVPHCQSTLDHVLTKVRESRDCVLTDHQQEILTGM